MSTSLLSKGSILALLAAGALAVGCGDDGGSGGSGGSGTGASGGGGSGTGASGGGGNGTGAGGSGQGGDTTSAGGMGQGGDTTSAGGMGQGGANPDLPSQADCATECTEGQTGQCTAITGDCNTCCGHLLVVATPSGCADELITYYECISAGVNACAAMCNTEEDAAIGCVQDYCLNNLFDPACQGLLGCGSAG